MKIHMVKKGESLYLIAQKYHVDLDKLIEMNPQITDPNVIEVGMKVKIPNGPTPVAPGNDYLYKHTVVQGDTLWKLSKAWNIPLNQMIEANPQLKNPNVLMTGDVVYIPKAHGHNQQTGQHYPHHHHKKNTAPIQPVPTPVSPIQVAPAPAKPPINVQPNVEMPIMPIMPNVNQHISPESIMPNANQQISPESIMPVMPNVNQHISPESIMPMMPNVNQQISPESIMPMMPNANQQPMVSPSVNQPSFQPNFVQPNVNQQPFVPEMPILPSATQQPNTSFKPNAPQPYPSVMPSYHEPNVNNAISPYSDNSHVMGTEATPNMPFQQPSSNLFEQFQMPATEVMNANMWPQQEQPNMWPQQEQPNMWPQQEQPNMWPQQEQPNMWPQQEQPNMWPQQEQPNMWPQQEQPNMWPQQEMPNMWAQPEMPNMWAQQEMPNMWPQQQMPSAEQMPFQSFAAPLPDYQMYGFMPQAGGGCGCGGEQVSPAFEQGKPFPNAPQMESPYMFQPNAQPFANTSSFPGMGYPTGEFYPQVAGAFTGPMFPMYGNPMTSFSPYSGGYNDCGCNDTSVGREQTEEIEADETLTISKNNQKSETKGANKKKRSSTQAAISRLSSSPRRSRTSLLKPKADKTPWINV
ncbi:LysM peptidoglycan-binding domain-containing protein [Paenibacillus sp. RC67]|uniref:LysM peptidoglycan-binding domain-containing protein n=1 Tax=Paenibacillus sp. RC67 TaxID=3039392 RepID=UPI0024AE6CE9|nr:LysM peptidoglycan-binding domain-containing protein [Paenibacillus sp. RC67]